MGLPLYDSVTEANRLEQIDLFDVCVPTYLHKAIVLEALACKKPVICEKPIALHLKDAQEMFDAAQANGVQLYVAQVLQFTREVEWLHRIVDERLYGEPLDACFERLSQRPAWSQGNWLFDREKSGLLPFDLHVHDLDVMVSVFGRPDSVDYTAWPPKGQRNLRPVPHPIRVSKRSDGQRGGGMAERLHPVHRQMARVF